MPRFVRYIADDGTVMDAILLTPVESGEGTASDLVVPIDRGSGVMAPTEATAGTGPGTYSEVV